MAMIKRQISVLVGQQRPLCIGKMQSGAATMESSGRLVFFFPLPCFKLNRNLQYSLAVPRYPSESLGESEKISLHKDLNADVFTVLFFIIAKE